MAIKIKKEELKTGDGLLVSSKSWLAKKIQLFQKNKWNHFGVMIECWGEWFVCESDKRGITLTAFDDYINSDKELLIVRPTFVYDQKKLSQFMLPYSGKVRYDYLTLLFFQAIYQVSGKWLGKKGEKAENAFVCSEWGAFVYNNMNKDIFPEWWKVAPADIFYSKNFLHFDFQK